MKELFIAAIPATMTNKSVSAIFGDHGRVMSCEVRHSTRFGPMAKLKINTAYSAARIVRNLNGTTPSGLELPIFVDLFEGSGWMWTT